MDGMNTQVVVGALGALGFLLLFVLRKGYPVLRAAVHLAELISGTPEQGSKKRVPGLGERLANIEYELKTNGGGSLKDAVVQIRDLAQSNAESVEAARRLAETAVAKAAETAEVFRTAEEIAKRERMLQQQSLEGLCAGLEDFAQEVHAKDMGTQRALRALGYPLADIVEAELGDEQ